MKRFSKLRMFIPLVAASLLYNCGGSDDSVFTPPVDTPDTTPELIVTEDGVGDKRAINVDADGLVAPVLVKFTTETNTMRRLYITSNVDGLGEEPYTFENEDVDSKADGSVDLKSDTKKELEYLINFPTPPTDTNSTIVYTLWTTTGRGDFRDAAKRNAIPVEEGEAATVGTITITRGTGGTSSSTDVRVLTDIKLYAPLSDGTSATFTSMYNGDVYDIKSGEETAALWDFGYYYGNTNKASLASTNDYPTSIIDVPTISKVPADQLNKCYFALSTKTAADFTAITLDSELSSIEQPANQAIKTLNVDDVIEFVDQYGNKGLIHVKELKAGNGTGDYIVLDMKLVN